MNKTKLLVLAAAPMLLASCNGISKVNFEKFQDKVKSIDVENLPDVEKLTIKGKVGDEKYNFTLNGLKDVTGLSLEEIAVATAALPFLRVEEFAVEEMKEAKYYVGMGFRVSAKEDDEKGEISWDKYGYVVKINMESEKEAMNLSVSYKYAK